MICVLSGGVGAARLLAALSGLVDPSTLRAVVNVGDDLQLHGLTICPDLDSITYTLAQLHNDELGWGLRNESWRVMDELGELGGESWFRLGDRDLATHLYRSERLSRGATKTQVASELAQRRGVKVHLLPVTNDEVATTLETEVGRLSFQEYFVRHRHGVTVKKIDYVGAREARLTPEVKHSLETASRIIIAPSNPLLSIAPILAVPGVRELLESHGQVVAVSPIVNGAALKGPADRLLAEHGYEISPVGVAQFYGPLVKTWVIDESDRHVASRLEELGHDVIVTTTVMSRPEHARALAEALS